MPNRSQYILLSIFWFVLIVSVAGCGLPAADSNQEYDLELVRKTVLELESEMNDAVDRNDCEAGLVHLGDREPIFIMQSQVVRSSGTLRERCNGRAAAFVSATFSIDSITVNVLSNDVAYVVREGNYTMNYVDGQIITRFGVMTTVWNRETDEWKMVHLHESWDGPWPAPNSQLE